MRPQDSTRATSNLVLVSSFAPVAMSARPSPTPCRGDLGRCECCCGRISFQRPIIGSAILSATGRTDYAVPAPMRECMPGSWAVPGVRGSLSFVKTRTQARVFLSHTDHDALLNKSRPSPFVQRPTAGFGKTFPGGMPSVPLVYVKIRAEWQANRG